MTGCPLCHPTNSDKALAGSQNADPSTETLPLNLTSSLIHRLIPNGRNMVHFMPALRCDSSIKTITDSAKKNQPEERTSGRDSPHRPLLSSTDNIRMWCDVLPIISLLHAHTDAAKSARCFKIKFFNLQYHYSERIYDNFL